MLRDHVKKTLERTEPGDREARDELQTILARTRGEVRPWWRVPAFALATGVLVAAAVVFFVRPKEHPQAVLPTPSSAVSAPAPEAALHLYLHVEGEPLDKALTLDVALGKSKGK